MPRAGTLSPEATTFVDETLARAIDIVDKWSGKEALKSSITEWFEHLDKSHNGRRFISEFLVPRSIRSMRSTSRARASVHCGTSRAARSIGASARPTC